MSPRAIRQKKTFILPAARDELDMGQEEAAPNLLRQSQLQRSAIASQYI